MVVSPSGSSLHVAPEPLPTLDVGESCGVSGPVLASRNESSGSEELNILVMDDEDGC